MPGWLLRTLWSAWRHASRARCGESWACTTAPASWGRVDAEQAAQHWRRQVREEHGAQQRQRKQQCCDIGGCCPTPSATAKAKQAEANQVLVASRDPLWTSCNLLLIFFGFIFMYFMGRRDGAQSGHSWW